MFSVKLQYDISKCDPAKLQAAKNDLLNGMSLDEVDEKHDCLGYAALIECAKDLGWDMDNYSAVPMYTRHKECLVALSKKLTGVKYLKHRQHILEMIDGLLETINREQIRDILEN